MRCLYPHAIVMRTPETHQTTPDPLLLPAWDYPAVQEEADDLFKVEATSRRS